MQSIQSFKSLFARIALVVIFAVTVSAQNIRYAENNLDQSMRGSLNVDPTSLGMSFSLTLGNYPGRQVNLPVSLSYSSKIWSILHRMTFQPQAGTTPLISLAGAQFAKDSISGWTISTDIPYWDTGNQTPAYDAAGATVCMTCEVAPDSAYFVERIFMHLPDGSTHELRKSGDPVFVLTGTNPPAVSGVYNSIDGSRMKYDADLGILFLPDGSRYEGIFNPANGPSDIQFIDRNGNTLSFNSIDQTWTDTLGRIINARLDNTIIAGDTKTQTITLPGFGNYSPGYQLIWKKLHAVLGLASENDMPYAGNFRCNGSNQTWPNFIFSSGIVEERICSEARFNPSVLTEIILPNGQHYVFDYNTFGELSKVTLPTGGYQRYEYAAVEGLDQDVSPIAGMYGKANRGVTTHYVCETGSCTPQQERVWTYSADNQDTLFKTTVTNSTGSKAERNIHTAINSPGFGFEDVKSGHAFEERTYTSTNQMIRRSLVQWERSTVSTSGATSNPRSVKRVEILLDTDGQNAKAAMTTNSYDPDLNQTSSESYDYTSVDLSIAQNSPIAAFVPGNILRSEESKFLVNDTSVSNRQLYRDRHLISLPSYSQVKLGSTVLAETQFKYDESALLTYGVTPTGWTDPGATTVRGNLTKTRRWLNVSGSSVLTHPGGSYLEATIQYDQFGNIRSATDPRGKTTQTVYADNFSEAPVNRNTFAYPTQTLTPQPDPTGQFGSTVAMTSSTQYEFKSGKVVSTTDANGQVVSYSYNINATNVEPLIRLTKIILPAGLGETTYAYSDNPGNLWMSVETRQNASTLLLDATYFDALGRAWRSVHKESATLWSLTDTEYDSLGRVKRVSNPYHASTVTGPINPSGVWTTTAYDDLNRVLTITATDGAVTTTQYTGNQVTVVDPAGKSRRSVTDGLGRLAQVVEDPGASPHLNYITDYSYDTLGNLIKVDQGGQQRFFFYDSLSRLVRARNPEQDANVSLAISPPPTYNNSWSLGYTYDPNGNLQTRTDARGVVTTYAYDNLNRNTTVTYSDGTPSVERHYDNAINGKGRFHFNYSGGNFSTGVNVEHTAVDSYDVLGRPLTGRQAFKTNGVWSQDFTSSRTYDLAGHILSQRYPAAPDRLVNYVYGADGRLSSFSGNLGGTQRTYADSFVYAPSGQLRSERFGTATPLYHQMDYNIRLQMEDVRLGTTLGSIAVSASSNRGRIQFIWDQIVGPPSGTNNGNLLGQTVYVPTSNGAVHEIPQGYGYDSLNRLISMSEEAALGNNQMPHYYYSYDRWGNRLQYSTDAYNQPQLTLLQNWDATEAAQTNRLKLPTGNNCPASGTKNGLCYDKAGNQIFDNVTGAGDRSYDGENRMISATGTNGANSYTYDADGRRTRRQVGSSQYWQVYGIGGELVAEYQWNGTTATLQKEYGEGGGVSIVAEGATVRWLVSDHLGTPRIIADQTGSLAGVTRHDYLPFGEENLTGSVRIGNGYQNEGVRQKFTGYERDGETTLDFAQARYYSNLFGRFTSIDPFDGSASLVEPQSWNRYSYVANQPTIATDPWGLQAVKYYIDGFEATADEVRAAIRGGWGIIAPAEIIRWNQNLFNGQGGWEQFRATSDGNAGWGYYGSVTTSSIVEETGEVLQSGTDVEWYWTRKVGTVVEWQGGFAFDTGVIRDGTGGIIGERGLEMQMLGPIDYIGVGEVKAGVAIAGLGIGSLRKYTPTLLGHIFKDTVGHVNPATLASQARYMKMFESVAANPANLKPNFPLNQAAANAGVQAYTQTFRNGKQVWVFVRNGKIVDAGVNLPGAHR